MNTWFTELTLPRRMSGVASWMITLRMTTLIWSEAPIAMGVAFVVAWKLRELFEYRTEAHARWKDEKQDTIEEPASAKELASNEESASAEEPASAPGS